jgi:spore maturation protein CgeB
LSNLGFIDGENCLIYSNIEELFEKARYVLENDDSRAKIEMAAIELAKRHTYKNRIEIIKRIL